MFLVVLDPHIGIRNRGLLRWAVSNRFSLIAVVREGLRIASVGSIRKFKEMAQLPNEEQNDWIKLDLHIHTLEDPKDALDYSAHELLERARALGFRVLAITLHDAVFDRDGATAVDPAPVGGGAVGWRAERTVVGHEAVPQGQAAAPAIPDPSAVCDDRGGAGSAGLIACDARVSEGERALIEDASARGK